MTKLTATKRAEIITAAVDMLQAGTLASALPQRLMSEYGLTAAQAKRLAEAALKQYGKEG
jgi:predicted transcriptional regulator